MNLYKLCILMDSERNYLLIVKFGRCVAVEKIADLHRIQKLHEGKIKINVDGEELTFDFKQLVVKIVDISVYPKILEIVKQVGKFDSDEFFNKFYRCVKKYDMDRYNGQTLCIVRISSESVKTTKLVTMSKELYECISYFKKYNLLIKMSINDIDDEDCDDEDIDYSFTLSDLDIEQLDRKYFEPYNDIYPIVADRSSIIRYILYTIVEFINIKLGLNYENKNYVEAFAIFRSSEKLSSGF